MTALRKPHILVLSDALHQPNYNPRTRHLLLSLKEAGYPLTFVSEGTNEHYHVKGISQYTFHYYRTKGIFLSLEFICKWVLRFCFNHKTHWFNKHVDQLFQTLQMEGKTPQFVLCSSFHTFPQPTACYIAKKYEIPYLADIRDLSEQADSASYNKHQIKPKILNKGINYLFQERYIRRRNRALKQATLLTTVSPWHCTMLKKVNPNTHLIYNGYDNKWFDFKAIPSSKFKIIYTGKVYPKSMQDPTLLFQALEDLPKEMLEMIEVHWYVNEISEARITQAMQPYALDGLMHFHPYVLNEMIPALLQECSLVLVLSNLLGPQGPFGVLTTKFFEAVGCQKPVLCVQSDEDLLAQTIRESKAGLAARTKTEVTQFIIRYFKQWQTQGYTKSEVLPAYKEKFSRATQDKEMVALIDAILFG